MSSVRASLRVPSPDGGRPDPQKVEEAARELRRYGFEILRVGRRGVSVEAESERFDAVFGVRPEPGHALTRKVHSKIDDLADLVDYMEVVPTPLPIDR